MFIHLHGKAISKKNNLRQRGAGLGYFNDPKVKAMEDYFLMQIPPEMVGIKVEHPDVSYEFTVPENNQRQDKDNLMTAVQDVLVKAGVFLNDNIKHHNGKITLLQAILGKKDEYGVKIWINEDPPIGE